MFAFNCCYKVVNQVSECFSEDISMNNRQVPKSLIDDVSFSQMCHSIIPSFIENISSTSSQIIDAYDDVSFSQIIDAYDDVSFSQIIDACDSTIIKPFVETNLTDISFSQIVHSPVVDISNEDVLDKLEIFLTKVEEP